MLEPNKEIFNSIETVVIFLPWFLVQEFLQIELNVGLVKHFFEFRVVIQVKLEFFDEACRKFAVLIC